jgi:hypothetical protein
MASKGTIASMTKATPKPAAPKGHPHANLGPYLHKPKGCK